MSGALRTLGLGRIGVVGGLSATLIAAGLGAGYSTTKALSNDQSAWLRKGVTIAEINGPAARPEAVVSDQPVALARSASDKLQVVELPNGQVYTADPVTHQVFRINLNTMTPGPSTAGTSVLTAGSTVYVLDPSGRKLTPVDPQNLSPGRPINLPAPAVSEVAASDGTAYVGESNGAVSVVRNGHAQTVKLAPSRDPLQVTVAGSQPVAIDPAASTAYPVGAGAAPINLPGPAGAPVEVGDNQGTGAVWLVQGVQLVSIDLATGRAQPVTLPAGHDYEAPVVSGNRVYVPDQTASAVLVFDASLMTQVQTISVPAGAPGNGSIEVVVKDGDVWIDNPTSRDAKVVASNGTVQTIDKGTGDGVVDPNAPKPARAGRGPTMPARKSSSPRSAPPALPAQNPVTTVPPVAAPTAPPTSPGPPSPPPTAPPPTAPPPTSPPPAVPPPASPPPTAPPPSIPPRTSPPAAATGSGPSRPAGPAGLAVPTDLVGQTYTSACAELQSRGLRCQVVYQHHAASSGTEGDVLAVNPAHGAVAPGTAVQLDVDEVAVPKPTSSETYNSYCATLHSLFTCKLVNRGQGPSTATPDAVVSVSPAPGTLEPPNPTQVTVTVGYYSSAAAPPAPAPTPTPPPPPPTPQSSVPDCTGLDFTACSQAMSAAHLLPVGVAQQSPSFACNQVSGATSPPAGQSVAQGTAVSIPYNVYCAVQTFEFNRTDETTDPYIFYLGQQQPSGGSWTKVNGTGYAYPLLNNACPKAGTAPLYQFEYPPTPGVIRYTHYNYSLNPNWYRSHSGWHAGTPVACQFSSGGAGRTAVYVESPGNPSKGQPSNYEWTISQVGTLAWYRPDGP